MGKGLTFDSGGYNLKAGVGSMIELMKFDMGGCGSVLGTSFIVWLVETFLIYSKSIIQLLIISLNLLLFPSLFLRGCSGTAKAISQLKPKNVEVHFITALCENMISGDSMRPGDVLTASNGLIFFFISWLTPIPEFISHSIQVKQSKF